MIWYVSLLNSFKDQGMTGMAACWLLSELSELASKGFWGTWECVYMTESNA